MVNLWPNYLFSNLFLLFYLFNSKQVLYLSRYLFKQSKILKMKKELKPTYKVVRLNFQSSKKETLSLHYSLKDAKLSFDYWANHVCNKVSYLTWKNKKLWDTGNNAPVMFYRNTMFQFDIWQYEIEKVK